MKTSLTALFALSLVFVTSLGCDSSAPAAIEQTMSQEEIDKMDADYEAEMEAAENDTMGED